MAQHDYVIANQSGAAFRSDLNSALSAIVSQNSGSAAPSTTFAYQLWADTTTGLLKIRNAANSAWVTVGDLATVNLGLASLASPTFTGTVTAPFFVASTAVRVPLGSDTGPSISITGDTNTGIYSPGADQLAITTGGQERARLDSSGRLLVGSSTARTNIGPSANTDPWFQLEGTGGNTSSAVFLRNTANSAGPQLHLAKTRSATLGGLTAVIQDDTVGAFTFQGSDGTNFYRGAQITGEVDGAVSLVNMPGRLVFSTNPGAGSPTEAVRITSAGFTKHADNGSYIGSTGSFHEFNNSTNNDVLKVRATVTGYTSACIATSTNIAAGTASYFVYGTANAVNTFQVLNNGNVKNTNNSYTAISDQKLKENITNAKSQWADIKALRIVNFRFKQETGLETYKQIGLIAQEVETISPGLVDETPEFKEVEVQTEVEKTRPVLDEDGNEITETYTETETSIERQPTGESIKGVKYSILYMKAIKALQEAMQRIEQLEAKVTALEAN